MFKPTLLDQEGRDDASGSEKRCCNILMGKLTRAILEAGGGKAVLEAEFATGSIWYRGQRRELWSRRVRYSWMWLGE